MLFEAGRGSFPTALHIVPLFPVSCIISSALFLASAVPAVRPDHLLATCYHHRHVLQQPAVKQSHNLIYCMTFFPHYHTIVVVVIGDIVIGLVSQRFRRRAARMNSIDVSSFDICKPQGELIRWICVDSA
jgi:hypothetical protein